MRHATFTSLLSLTLALGCAGGSSNALVSGDLLVSADEQATTQDGLNTALPIGSRLATTANLNLRTGPGLGYHIRLVIPDGALVTTVNRTTPEGSWYNISFNGVTGWSHGGYLHATQGQAAAPPAAGSGTRAAALSRARSGVGFSYWWGHGRWQPGGVSGSSAGSCSGACPNCSHSGSNGADCSGFLAKVWQVPSSNDELAVDSHPYTTATFNGSSSQWSTVSRASARPGDAFVYNTNGAGHAFVYESGDGWGSMWTYEARGCSYGIVHNLRTASGSYKAIAHY